MVEHREGYSNIRIKRTFVVSRDLNPGWLDSMPVLWRLCHQHGFEEAAVGVLAFCGQSSTCGVIDLL